MLSSLVRFLQKFLIKNSAYPDGQIGLAYLEVNAG